MYYYVAMTALAAPETEEFPALDLTWSFGDRVAKVRHAIGLQQAEMAKALGVNQVTVSTWERFGREPRGITVLAKRLQLVTGIPAAWFLGLTEDWTPVTPPNIASGPTGTRTRNLQIKSL